MEREILFRGKLRHSGVWVEGNLIKDRNGNKYIIPFNVFEPDGHHLIIDSDEAWRVDPETVGQFTGMTDKNGKRIFEGDIVRYTDTTSHVVEVVNSEVYFDTEMLKFGFRYSNELFHCQFNNEFEVIGNIYDNKELLK